jgi:hypothetical protein
VFPWETVDQPIIERPLSIFEQLKAELADFLWKATVDLDSTVYVLTDAFEWSDPIIELQVQVGGRPNLCEEGSLFICSYPKADFTCTW